MRLFLNYMTAAFLFFSISPAYAEEKSTTISDNGYDPDSWIVTLKASIGASPKWNGSDDFSFVGFPGISLRRPWKPAVWQSPDDNPGFSFIDQSGFSLGAAFKYRGGRDSKDDRLLLGIHDTHWTVEGGLFVHYWAVPEVLRAKMEVRHGVRSDDGLVADFGVDVVQKYNQFTFAVGPRLTLANSQFMRYHFGITEADAFHNGILSSWHPDGGLYSAGVFSSIEYQLDEKWSIGVHGGWERLLADAAKSPIIKEAGSQDQFSVGATVKYTFDWKWSGLGVFSDN